MRPQETRLRRKRSHMRCNLVNFISVNRELEVGRGWQQGGEKMRQKKKKSQKNPNRREKEVWEDGISYHHHGFEDAQ